ncbi:hypothetical protein BT67DRAFT_454651 [Trichocladium antarcticum]|uniref:Uncharacterized protein n=1 Tax=Trichocladium antarcticum TaxID=1450529 RepID=A0AAN6UPP9_9PEZI|nr:hypothetical protein BT67DRAFT_454651 [Trichocladium antarcticum]
MADLDTSKAPIVIDSPPNKQKPKPTPSASASASGKRTPGGKYGPCPRCLTGRRVRSRFKPFGASPHAGKFRFVCSNRPVAVGRDAGDGGDGAPQEGTGCGFWEVLESDPLEDPGAYQLTTPRNGGMARMDVFAGEDDESDATARDDERGLIHLAGQTEAGRSSGTDYDDLGSEDERQLIQLAGHTEAQEKSNSRDYDGFSSEDGQELLRPTAHAVPRQNDLDACEYDEFDSGDEKELVQLTDQIMDEFGEEDEAGLIQLADTVSALFPLQSRLSRAGG